ncbi:MAG TPA: prepilin-type N-terminal cleavage/methylation domain-containing protein [Hellea balneolensis]|uniref:Prepilin-type N-terminal cleavage/methylation domain-containing protein n=1 Tax=Hellea balneolensis TaxID=287478 RepID=A0A7C5LZ50_9PROT|nr:prepilin-type N-terminal cleavage/methylation domain-containing protein [Hellea balneolensis]
MGVSAYKVRMNFNQTQSVGCVVGHGDQGSGGFTLLETMIALALMSLTSLALFQSATALLRVSDRAVRIASTTIDESIERQTFMDIVSKLVPAWEEDAAHIFTGGPKGFSGLTAADPTAFSPRITPFEIKLVAKNETTPVNNVILYSAGQGMKIGSFETANLEFAYLGNDGIWRQSWPPETPPSSGFYDDYKYMDVPQLPLAIRLGTSGKGVGWVASVANASYPPLRDRFGYD